MKDFRSLAHVRWECKYYVVFIPKYRQKVMDGELRDTMGGGSGAMFCKEKGIGLLLAVVVTSAAWDDGAAAPQCSATRQRQMSQTDQNLGEDNIVSQNHELDRWLEKHRDHWDLDDQVKSAGRSSRFKRTKS